MAHKPNMTMQVTDEEKSALRWLAGQWGMTIGRGSMAEEGSIRELVLKIANGEAGFFLIDDSKDYALAGELRSLASEKPGLADLLDRVATALGRAGEIHSEL